MYIYMYIVIIIRRQTYKTSYITGEIIYLHVYMYIYIYVYTYIYIYWGWSRCHRWKAAPCAAWSICQGCLFSVSDSYSLYFSHDDLCEHCYLFQWRFPGTTNASLAVSRTSSWLQIGNACLFRWDSITNWDLSKRINIPMQPEYTATLLQAVCWDGGA